MGQTLHLFQQAFITLAIKANFNWIKFELFSEQSFKFASLNLTSMKSHVAIENFVFSKN